MSSLGWVSIVAFAVSLSDGWVVEACVLEAVLDCSCNRSIRPSARCLSYVRMMRSAMPRSENASSATTEGKVSVKRQLRSAFPPDSSVASDAMADSMSAAVVPGAKFEAVTV